MLTTRSLLFNALFYLNLVVLMIIGLPTMLFGRKAVFALARLWGAISVWLLGKICGLRLEYRGVENIPPGAILIAAKHQSFLETFALIKYAPDFAIILKRQLTYVPLFGLYLIVSKQIAIDRARGRQALQQIAGAAKPVFAAGRQVFIYPEGTRRLPGAPPKYKQGVTALYVETGVACLPVAVNTGLFWRRRGFLRRPGLAVIEYLPVIAPGLDRAEFSKRLQSTIESACDRLNAEAVDKDPSLAAVLAEGASSDAETLRSLLTRILLCSINVLVIIRVGTMTLAYENEPVDEPCGVSESPSAAWVAPVSDRQGVRRLAGCAGRHADLLPILFVDRAVGAALRLLCLSGVGLPGVLRRGPVGRGPRHDRAAARHLGARDWGLSGTGRRQGSARTPGLRPRR